VDALEQAIIELYGSAAGGVVFSGNIASHSFLELQKMMDGQAASSAVDTNIRRAQWIIFLALDLDSDRPESYALRRFLSERPDLARDKRIIAFAANAPYYLDATDISKLTAFYGLYSKTPSFVDVAARLLFKEIQPEGASPVSVPGVGYDLISATSPNPEREIVLHVDLPGFNLTEDAISSMARFRTGDTIPVKTGTILDFNGNPVPDNTPVEFQISTNETEVPVITSATEGGVAKASILIEQSGLIEIQAQSGSAHSDILLVDVPEELPSPTPSPTVIPTEEPTLIPSPTVEILTTPPPAEPPSEPDFTGVTLWLLATGTSCLIGWLALRVGALLGQVRWGVRWGLATVIGGLLAYTYAVLQLPGSQWAFETPYHWGLMLVTLLGALIGWGIGVVIRFNGNGNRK
jgi:beta-N-acetylhexosaminidase